MRTIQWAKVIFSWWFWLPAVVAVLVVWNWAVAQPPRYFEWDLELVVDQKPYSFHYSWRCLDHLQWDESGRTFMGFFRGWDQSIAMTRRVKRLDDNATLLFGPLNAACWDDAFGTGGDDRRFQPSIAIIDDALHPSSMQLMNEPAIGDTLRDPVGNYVGVSHVVVIKVQKYRRLSNRTPDYFPISEEEKRIKQTLQNMPGGWQTVTAVILPESEWAKSDEAQRYFQGAKEILIAPPPASHRTDQVGDANAFPVDQRSLFVEDQMPQPVDKRPRFRVPLVKTGDTWRLPSEPISKDVTIWAAVPKTWGNGRPPYQIGMPPPATIEYEGITRAIPVSQQIFDPKKRVLITFENEYRDLPWIGAREDD